MKNKFIREKVRLSVLHFTLQHHPSTPVTAMTALTAMKMEKIQGTQQFNFLKWGNTFLFLFLRGAFMLKRVKEGEVEGGAVYDHGMLMVV